MHEISEKVVKHGWSSYYKTLDMSSGEAVVSRYLRDLGKQIGSQWGRLQYYLGRLQYHLGGATHVPEIREGKRHTPDMSSREM